MERRVSLFLFVIILSLSLFSCSSLRNQYKSDESFQEDNPDSLYYYDDEERDWEYDFQD